MQVACTLVLAVGSVPLLMGLSVGLLECPHNVVNGFPRAIAQETMMEAAMPFLT